MVLNVFYQLALLVIVVVVYLLSQSDAGIFETTYSQSNVEAEVSQHCLGFVHLIAAGSEGQYHLDVIQN